MSRTLKCTRVERDEKRRQLDITNLLMKDYKVEMHDDNMDEFHVIFHGHDDTPYEGGVWRIKVKLPIDYPMNAPLIRFLNKIYHPNINEGVGLVCLDVLQQNWSPAFDLSNVFDTFIPQLLTYPNTASPMNTEAAHLMDSDPALYERRVKEYCERYAKREDILPDEEKVDDEKTSEDEKDSDDDKVEGGDAQ